MAHASANPAGTTADEYPAPAGFHAGVSASGIGAAVVRSGIEDEVHFWDCVVTDGRKWHYIRVLGPDLGPFPSTPNDDIEGAIDRFAATLPTDYRLSALLNANPLHLHRSGEITD